MILLFEMVPKRSAEMLFTSSSGPKYRKAVMCFTEKTHVIGNLYSGMTYRAIGHEFNVNESTICTK